MIEIKYFINGLDFTDLVYSKPKLTKKVGSGSSSLATNNIQLNVLNEDYLFSLENENSVLYEYRGDYSQIDVEITENGLTKWKGVVDNITRNQDGTILLACVESIVKVLSVSEFIYYSGDGFVGDLEYAGDDVTPAEHQLTILRRFLSDDNIDVASFKDLIDFWEENSVYCSCEIIRESQKTPLAFIQDLLMKAGYLVIDNNKIRVELYREFLGDYGILLDDEVIINISSIEKEKYENPYYSYSITYDNAGEPDIKEGSAGDNGTSTDTTSNTLTDTTKEWDIDEWKDQFLFIGNPGEKDILKITGNNKTQIFFSGCTKAGEQTYVITKNSEVYQADHSDFPIKISTGAAMIGLLAINKSTQEKLKIEFDVLDYMGLDIGDIITLNIPDEGINYQTFKVTEFKKELYSDIAQIVCIDRILYPLLEEWQIAELGDPVNLTGFRVTDGSAYITWDVVYGAAYYIIGYGTSPDAPKYTTRSYTRENVHISDHMEEWLGYYFWVTAVNFIGLRSPVSQPLFLEKISQGSGYIDGSEGYLIEKYVNWGYLENYFFSLVYKNLSYEDISFLLKTPLTVLQSTQVSSVEETSQLQADSIASQKWSDQYRRLGYIDGAGVLSSSFEFVEDAINGHKIKNPLEKQITIDISGLPTVIAADAEIPGSDEWFLKDKDDNYCTYKFGLGYMLDVNNEDFQSWFMVYKINKTMGIWENGIGNIAVDEDTQEAVLTHATKSWITDQWEDYYVGIITTTNPLTINWYQIKSNTDITLTFDYDETEDITGQKYIINNQPYAGFHGIILDNIWTSIFSNGINLSESDENTTSNSSTSTVLTDSSKSWTIDEWIGYYVSIDSGPLLEITDNTETTLTFSGNLNPGSGQSYIIYEKYYNDAGMYYWQAMSDFLEMVIEQIEDNSYNQFDNWTKVEQGNIIVNCNPDKWDAYADYVSSINRRYKHYVMLENLQCAWNDDNEVTKQFIIRDWYETVQKWQQMKISGGVGYAKIATLGYPPHQQMFISHLVAGLILTKYDDGIEDIITAGNPVLDQLYYDMAMAGNYLSMKTIGNPDEGYENSYVQNQYDRYGIIIRNFEGAYILYNPSRQIRTIEYTFDDNVIDFHTGIEYEYGSYYEFILMPRSAIILYKLSGPAEDAYSFLYNYEPYSYVDFNACWIVFTSVGSANIGTKSVWIENGYTNNRRFIVEGGQTIPDGETERLFHAGNGIDTSVSGNDSETEVITGVAAGNSVQLTSLTVLNIVKLKIINNEIQQINNIYKFYFTPGASGIFSRNADFVSDEFIGYFIILGIELVEIYDNDSESIRWLTYNYENPSISYEIPSLGISGNTSYYMYDEDYPDRTQIWDYTKSWGDGELDGYFISINGGDLLEITRSGGQEAIFTVTENPFPFDISNIFYIYEYESGSFNGNAEFFNFSFNSGSIQDSTKSWGIDELIGYKVSINGGDLLEITSNTENVFSFETTSSPVPSVYYEIDSTAIDGNTDQYVFYGVDGQAIIIDETKSWIDDELVGEYVSINGSSLLEIISNTENTLTTEICSNPFPAIFYGLIFLNLTSETDFLVEKKEWDITESGKGKWKTYLYFLTDQSEKNLTVSYYEMGEESGWPKSIEDGDEIEHGFCYRKNSGFALKTGGVDEADCIIELEDGVDYFVLPECVRWKWDYRINPFGYFNSDQTFDFTINLNSIYEVGGVGDIKGIHWGMIDADNAILIGSDDEKYNSINGVKADYSSSTIVRPKVLIYGFTAPARDSNLTAIAPASRTNDPYSFENNFKNFDNIYYDDVYITGDWDGIIKAGSSSGAWGSINGIINDPGESDFNSWQDIADYFDVIIINNIFQEYKSGSVSGKAQYSSWLEANDYYLIKNFKKRSAQSGRDTILFDRRFGATAFVWYGGIKPIRDYLICKGSALTGGSSIYTDLTDVFGCFAYAKIEISDLSNSDSNVYRKNENDSYIKYSSSLTSDNRIGKSIDITDQYVFDEDNEDEHPIYNITENEKSTIYYIPKSLDGRDDYFNNEDIVCEGSNLYLQWRKITDLVYAEDNYIQYEEIGLNNIILRREPFLILHTHGYFNVTRNFDEDGDLGNRSTVIAIKYPNPHIGNVGYYRCVPFFYLSSGKMNFITGKYLYFLESEESDYTPSFSFSSYKWMGYDGHYASYFSNQVWTLDDGINYEDAGWALYDKRKASGVKYWGWFFQARSAMTNLKKMLFFSPYNDDVGARYPMTKVENPDGCIPYYRNVEEGSDDFYEGNISRIVKNGDGTVTIYVTFDISDISPLTPVASGTITSVSSSILDFKYLYYRTNIDMRSYRNGDYYCHVTTETGIKVLKIRDDGESYLQAGRNMNKKDMPVGHNGSFSHNGCSFNIYKSADSKVFKVATFQTASERNIVYNSTILSKNNSQRSVTIYLDRGVNQSYSFGSIIFFKGEEDGETIDDNANLTTQIGNRDALGGRVPGVNDIIGLDISTSFRSTGKADLTKPRNILESLAIKNKPVSIKHYEFVYGKLTKEFGYEKNTGLVIAQKFTPHDNRPPIIIWPGVSENDVHAIINKKIGTKITFNDLTVQAGDTLYLYYNSFNDMLKIKAEDVENAIDGYYKLGDLRSDDQTLLEAIKKNNTEED
jgi:hypothetical protein